MFCISLCLVVLVSRLSVLFVLVSISSLMLGNPTVLQSTRLFLVWCCCALTAALYFFFPHFSPCVCCHLFPVLCSFHYVICSQLSAISSSLLFQYPKFVTISSSTLLHHYFPFNISWSPFLSLFWCRHCLISIAQSPFSSLFLRGHLLVAILLSVFFITVFRGRFLLRFSVIIFRCLIFISVSLSPSICRGSSLPFFSPFSSLFLVIIFVLSHCFLIFLFRRSFLAIFVVVSLLPFLCRKCLSAVFAPVSSLTFLFAISSSSFFCTHF